MKDYVIKMEKGIIPSLLVLFFVVEAVTIVAPYIE